MRYVRFIGLMLGLTGMADGASPPANYDVVVVGGTPAGIAAAIAAGRAGKSVLIVEQAPVLGGMLSSGVSMADDSLLGGTSGVFEEFRQQVRRYHLTQLADDPAVRNRYLPSNVRWNAAEGQAWEPKTAARIFGAMVRAVPKISVRFNEVPVGALLDGDRVVGVTAQERDNHGRLGGQRQYRGRVIIDATYEGDVAALAGVPFRIGREARSPEEPHAGLIHTDAFCEGAKSLPGTINPGSTGRADDQLQAFAIRFVAKDYGRPDHPFRLKAPPAGYDPKLYKWNAASKPFLPNRKYDMLGINWGGDLTGLSTQYVLADWPRRAAIERLYRNYSLGWLYYVQTEGGSPNIGLADDEFTDNEYLPYRLYVREGRRIEGRYTLTESDIHKDLGGDGSRGRPQPTSIAVGLYEIDSHNVQAPVDRASPCSGEGAVNLMDVSGPYGIPYGVMVPRARKGILVPVAVSSTHLAMSTVRMEPVWASLGQAAGTAAAMAISHGWEVDQVPVGQIQHALLVQRSFLFFYRDLPADQASFEAIERLSLLGAMDGNGNYLFRPDAPITLGELARALVVGLNVPLSITAAHFADLPREHPAFRYVETLYDEATRSGRWALPYEIRDFLNYHQYSTKLGPPVHVYPDQPITAETFTRIASGLTGRAMALRPDGKGLVTRAEAARIIDGLVRKTPAPKSATALQPANTANQH